MDASDLVAEKEEEVKRTREEAKRTREELYKQTYLSKLFDSIYNVLKENLHDTEVITKLRNIERNLIVSYITDKSDRKSLKEGLETIEIKYRHNKQIKKYVKTILNKLDLN